MSGMRRLAVFLSLLWLTLVAVLSWNDYNSGQVIGLFAVLPLGFLWGLWWVITGGKARVESSVIPRDRPGDPDLRNETASPTSATTEARGKGVLGVLGNLGIVLAAIMVIILVGALSDITKSYVDKVKARSLLEQIEEGAKSPADLFREAIKKGRAGFLEGYSRSVHSRLVGQNPEQSEVQVTDPDTSDLGSVFVVSANFSGQVFLNGMEGRHRVKGVTGTYVYENGIYSLEGLCFLEKSDCSEFLDRVSAAETALLANLEVSGIGNIMPRSTSDTCGMETSHTLVGNKSVDVAFCVYDPGILVSLSRVSREESADILAHLLDRQIQR